MITKETTFKIKNIHQTLLFKVNEYSEVTMYKVTNGYENFILATNIKTLEEILDKLKGAIQ